MKCFSFLLALLLCTTGLHAQQLIINEFSQGANGAQEYIELVVVGQRTCAGDSCADIRGWIVDDNNGWYGAGGGQGIAQGHIRFSNDPNWSCVPYGSVILLYNLGDKNPVITLADDPSDVNGDHVYVLPSVSSLMEGTTATPVSPSSPSYVYPAATYTASPAWAAIGLANTGDAVIVVDPATPGIAHHSIAYGNLTSAGSATISKTTAGAARNYYLVDDQFTSSASYNVGNAPADETPGAPNTTANAAWITDMLTNAGGATNTDLFACIQQGGSYNFNGVPLTVAGTYDDTFVTTLGCDSIVHLHLSVVIPAAVNGSITSCQPVTFNGVTYTSSAVVIDTMQSVSGCDSAYINMAIQIYNVTTSEARDTVSGCQRIVYKGVPYTVSQQVTDTIKTFAGCDSIYKYVYLRILPTPVVNVPDNPVICEGGSITLTAAADYPVTWDGYDAGQETITVSPEETTAYTARTYNELNCEGIGVAVVTVEHFRLALQAAATETEIGSPVTIDVVGNHDFTVTGWQPAALFPDQHSRHQSVLFNEQGAAVIMVSGESANGCLDTASVTIRVLPRPEVFIPTAFSPNGDGSNDYFRPLFVRDHVVRDFSVFNRWGQKVYGASYMQQPDKGWDGSFRGKDCDAGTYYYILSVQDALGHESVLRGDVTLVH